MYNISKKLFNYLFENALNREINHKDIHRSKDVHLS